MKSTAATGLIPDTTFYQYYNGHRVKDLRYIHKTLRELGCGSFIFLCGDSSLDNKHWFFAKGASRGEHTPSTIGEGEMRDDAITAPAINGYESVLQSACRNPTRKDPRMAKDVSYWLNFHSPDERSLCTIMAAVEASTAADRHEYRLLKQDEFIRDNVGEDDYIVMSVGGNDIAMAPTVATIVNVALLNLSPHWLIVLGLAPGHRHLTSWMATMVISYVQALTAKTRPKKVVCSMIYYPSVTPSGGWADVALGVLLYRGDSGYDTVLGRIWRPLGYIGYFACPSMLQLVIRTLYRSLEARLADARQPGGPLAGVDVVAFPLFDVLDGMTPSDYNQRVEPSVQGGEKMAKALLKLLAHDGDTRDGRGSSVDRGAATRRRSTSREPKLRKEA